MQRSVFWAFKMSHRLVCSLKLQDQSRTQRNLRHPSGLNEIIVQIIEMEAGRRDSTELKIKLSTGAQLRIYSKRHREGKNEMKCEGAPKKVAPPMNNECSFYSFLALLQYPTFTLLPPFSCLKLVTTIQRPDVPCPMGFVFTPMQINTIDESIMSRTRADPTQTRKHTVWELSELQNCSSARSWIQMRFFICTENILRAVYE